MPYSTVGLPSCTTTSCEFENGHNFIKVHLLFCIYSDWMLSCFECGWQVLQTLQPSQSWRCLPDAGYVNGKEWGGAVGAGVVEQRTRAMIYFIFALLRCPMPACLVQFS